MTETTNLHGTGEIETATIETTIALDQDETGADLRSEIDEIEADLENEADEMMTDMIHDIEIDTATNTETTIDTTRALHIEVSTPTQAQQGGGKTGQITSNSCLVPNHNLYRTPFSLPNSIFDHIPVHIRLQASLVLHHHLSLPTSSLILLLPKFASTIVFV